MSVRIKDYQLTFNSHKLYDVCLNDTEIETVVTRDPGTVCSWINNTEIQNQCRLHRLIVGIDVEWRPNFNPGAGQNPVATLQLFVGVGIEIDAKKLWDDYGLEVSNKVDLREWAAEELDNENLCNAGLRDLVKEIVGTEIHKPKKVTLSAWDQRWLSLEQICYACLDAYLSFEVGRLLSSWYN